MIDLKSVTQAIRDKLAGLPADSPLKAAISEEFQQGIDRTIQTRSERELEWGYLPPSYLLVEQSTPDQLGALNDDLRLILAHTPEGQRGSVTRFLSTGERIEREWSGGLFETFIKARFLRSFGSSVTLDAALPNGRNSDLLLSLTNQSVRIECSVLSTANDDRAAWDARMQHEIGEIDRATLKMKDDSRVSEYDVTRRLYSKVYDKIAQDLNPARSQFSRDAMNFLMLSVEDAVGRLGSDSMGLGWGFDELFADQPRGCNGHTLDNEANICLGCWIKNAFNRAAQARRVTQQDFLRNYDALHHAPRVISGVFVFERLSFSFARVNYNAVKPCRAPHRLMADLEDLVRQPPAYNF